MIDMTKEERKEYNKNWGKVNKDKIREYKESNKNAYYNSKEYRKEASLKYRKNNYELFLLM